MKQRRIGQGIGLIFMASLTVFGESDNQSKLKVNCNAPGRKLSQAIQQADPGDVIEVRGICRERVTITRGSLTLDGGGDAVLDGIGIPPSGGEFNGLLTVDGAPGIVIRGWTIRNSSGEGILGLRGAGMLIQDTVVERNHLGVALSNSSAEIIDSAIRKNTTGGVDGFSNSTVILRGQMDMSGNLEGPALVLNGNSLAEIRGGHVRASNNGGEGVIISGGSTLAIFGFQASQGSRLTTNGNRGIGIVIGQGQLLVTGGTLPPGGIVITSSSNLGPGILLAGGVITSPFGAAKFVVENNPIGMQFLQGSSATIIGGLQVSRNTTTGIAADNATGLTFVSIPPNPSAIQLNGGTDVTLGFGTKSTIDGVAVGTIVCDGTVLSRGTKVCP